MAILLVGVAAVIGWGSPAPSKCTPSSIGTASCQLPMNGCDGVYRVGIGRCESGTGTCTGTGVSVCGGTVNFSPSFTNAPNPSTGYTTILANGLLPAQITVKDANSTTPWYFFSLTSTGQTWISMPAAQTEIFGDAGGQHQQIVNWHDQVQADFIVNCNVASNHAGANLQVQYSTALASGVWTSITGLSVLVDASTGACGVSPIDSCYSASLTTLGCFVNIPLAAQIDGLQLRIVGVNGGGVGDNPVFISAYLMTHTASVSTVIGGTCVARLSSNTLATVSSFTFTIGCAIVFSVTIHFYWQAWSYTG